MARQRPPGPRRAAGRGGPGERQGLQAVGEGVPPEEHLRGGGKGRARSWLGEEEGRGSRDGTGRMRSGGQRRQRRRVGPWPNRRRSGQRGWLEGEEEGQVGCSILGWWRAAHYCKENKRKTQRFRCMLFYVFVL